MESIKSRVEAELKLNHGIRVNLNIFGVDEGETGEDDDDDEFGTATALKVLKDKLVKDCMIVSCDLMTNVNIQAMANFYRINNASFVALLADSVVQNFDLSVPGSKGKYDPGLKSSIIVIIL